MTSSIPFASSFPNSNGKITVVTTSVAGVSNFPVSKFNSGWFCTKAIIHSPLSLFAKTEKPFAY